MKQTKLWTLVMMLLLLLTMACGNGDQKEQSVAAEKLLERAQKANDYERLMKLADSLEKAKVLTAEKAFYWLGYASDRLNKKRMAEFYWKSSLEAAEKNGKDADMEADAKSASRLANLLTVRGDYEGVLKGAIPAALKQEELKCDTTSDYVNLLIYIGCCQAGLGETSDSTSDGFERAYHKHLESIENHRSDASYKNAIAGLINISYACLTIKKYQEAQKWIERFGELLKDYEQRPDHSIIYTDKQVARFNIYQALAYEGLEKKEEAAKAFDAFLTTEYSKTPEGRIAANEYLMAAQRWDEAANNYRSLDALMGEGSTNTMMDDIENLLLKKYQANLIAGRKDSAMAVSKAISDLLEPAFKQMRQLDKEEQATIVANVERLSEQQAQLESRNRLTWYVLFALIFLVFIGYIMYRRYVGHQLMVAHRQLKEAYNQVEANTATKERTALEQEIAGSIQQTLLPTTLPRRKDVQAFATVIPGKMQGSGLCETMIRDEKLYFFAADAVGEGAQASALTAIMKAQFRMAAAYEDEPENIITTMKAAYDKGVKCFAGVLDLATGSLKISQEDYHLPLVMNEDVKRLTDEEHLQSGSLILLYTDGLTNAVNGEGKKFGEKRMMGEALQAVKINAAPKPFVDTMTEAVKRFTGDIAQQEDIIMLAIRYTKG